jgi:hypothetical protein
MVDYDKFYLIKDCLSNKPFRGKIVNYELASAEIARGENRINEIPKILHAMGGSKLYDIIWTTNAFPLIVSEFIINLLNDNSISGWKTYDVEIFNKEHEKIDEKYFGLIITGRCGTQDFSKSKIIEDKIGVKLVATLKGFYFQNDFWDGSDLFMCNADLNEKTTMHRFCSEKVMKLFAKEKVMNIDFLKTDEYKIPLFAVKTKLTEQQEKDLSEM